MIDAPPSWTFWMMARTDNVSFSVFSVIRRSATSAGSRRGFPRSVRGLG